MSTPQEKAFEIAAQCWCDPNCTNKTMDTDLALSFANRYQKLLQRIQELEEKNEKLMQACKKAYDFVDDEINNKIIVEMDGLFGLHHDLADALGFLYPEYIKDKEEYFQ